MDSIRPIHILLAVAFIPGLLPALAQQPNVARYDLKLSELKYDYAVAPPVLHLQPGEVLETNTIDADGHALEDAGMKVGGPNPLTGPFYIDGAEAGDTLAIHFMAVDVNAEKGFGSAGPGFGAINSTTYTPMLGGPIPRESWTYLIDKKTNTAAFKANNSTTPCPYHCIRSWVAWAWPRPKARHAARLPPQSTAETWTLPRRLPATHCICR